MEPVNYTPIEILLVEDNEDDVILTTQAFKRGKVSNNLHVAADGVEALAFLHKEGRYAASPRPDIILLDLNLPRMDGHEFLKIVKADPLFSSIPVVILTTSKAEEDVIKSYEHHSNCFVSKPVTMEEFDQVIRTLEDFWFVIVRLPQEKVGKNAPGAPGRPENGGKL